MTFELDPLSSAEEEAAVEAALADELTAAEVLRVRELLEEPAALTL